MKATAAAVLASDTLVSCWRIVRVDGTVLGFTTHDTDIVYDSVTYEAASGFAPTATRQTDTTAADSQDVEGIFDSASITEEDLAAGLYAGARVYHFEIDWSDSGASGIHKLDAGIIGDISRTRTGFNAGVMGLKDLLTQVIGRTYTKSCWHTLGDAGCGITLEPTAWAATTAYALLDVVSPTTADGRRYVCTTAGTSGGSEPTWDTVVGNTTNDGSVVWTTYEAYTKTGTLTSATSDQVISDSGRGEADDDFTYGWIEFTSGDNSGIQIPIKDYTGATGTFTLLFPAPFTVAGTETYKAVRGCNKHLKLSGDVWGTAYTGDCRVKFNTENSGNAKRFGGYPELPGDDKIFAGP